MQTVGGATKLISVFVKDMYQRSFRFTDLGKQLQASGGHCVFLCEYEFFIPSRQNHRRNLVRNETPMTPSLESR